MEPITAVLFLIFAIVWTNQTFSKPPKKEEKTPEQEFAEALGKYLSKGNKKEFNFAIKIDKEDSK